LPAHWTGAVAGASAAVMSYEVIQATRDVPAGSAQDVESPASGDALSAVTGGLLVGSGLGVAGSGGLSQAGITTAA
jgi:hypothetical protein